MASKRAGRSPTDTSVDEADRAKSPWSDFRKVIDEMFGLLEGVRPAGGASGPGAASRRAPADGGGAR